MWKLKRNIFQLWLWSFKSTAKGILCSQNTEMNFHFEILAQKKLISTSFGSQQFKTIVWYEKRPQNIKEHPMLFPFTHFSLQTSIRKWSLFMLLLAGTFWQIEGKIYCQTVVWNLQWHYDKLTKLSPVFGLNYEGNRDVKILRDSLLASVLPVPAEWISFWHVIVPELPNTNNNINHLKLDSAFWGWYESCSLYQKSGMK